ncbi:MAG: hypothetical protein KDI11_08785 [Alphaproteobacteria bacterium]|nr:hypothetical protein [Alphaproteobacteria bacterium]
MDDKNIQNFSQNSGRTDDTGAVVETVVEVTAGAMKVAVPVALAAKIGAKRLPWLLGTAATTGFVIDEVEAHWENGDVCKAFGAALAGAAETGAVTFIPGSNEFFLGDVFHKAVRESYIWVTEGLFSFEEGQCTPNETDIVAAVDYLSSDGTPRVAMAINDEKLAP